MIPAPRRNHSPGPVPVYMGPALKPQPDEAERRVQLVRFPGERQPAGATGGTIEKRYGSFCPTGTENPRRHGNNGTHQRVQANANMERILEVLLTASGPLAAAQISARTGLTYLSVARRLREHRYICKLARKPPLYWHVDNDAAVREQLGLRSTKEGD